MKQVVILGGCGAVGSVAARTLAKQSEFSTIVIADIRLNKAESLAAKIGAKAKAVHVDASSKESIADAIKGSDIVLNCVGPFYKTVKTVLATVMEAGINYVDICDDVDVTLDILGWSERAQAAGITALIGMGSSPGVTNVLAKLAATTMLDETESVDIFHVHGGEPIEGPGVIGHRFHCMSIDIPMYLDSKLQYVKYFEPDGIALRQKFHFPVIDEEVLLYPYPHPEQVTLPDYLDLQQVTNKGSVLPGKYYDLTRDICALGLHSRTPISVNGTDVSPYDFSIAYILEQRERILEEMNFGNQRGCVSVLVNGRSHGEKMEYRFHLASRSEALGEGTGIPAAMGVILVARGKIDKKGVWPPEACVDPADFLDLIPSVMDMEKGGDNKGFDGVIVEQIDARGNLKRLDL